MEENKPLPFYQIEDLDTLRTLADPLRTQIYEILLAEPANVREVAERLGLAPSRLYYHFNLLEKVNLIKVVETRMVGNMVEKFYRAVAYNLDVAPGLLDFQKSELKETLDELLTVSLDATREDLIRSVNARLIDLEQGAVEKPRRVMVNRLTARIPDDVADEFHKRLNELLAEFGASDTASQDGEPLQQYALTIAYYPTFYYSSDKHPSVQDEPNQKE